MSDEVRGGEQGLEQLLRLAAQDSLFRRELLDDPLNAAAIWRIPLCPSEEATLTGVSQERLAGMIRAMQDTLAEERQRRREEQEGRARLSPSRGIRP